ncbi:GNAT family N-acetyltransferase [Ancylobacter moscoviensis]
MTDTTDASFPPTLNLDGYTPLPPGKIATIVTHLEITAQPSALREPPDSGLTLERVDAPDTGWYRDLFRRIGEPWLWYSRLRMDEAALRGVIADPEVAVHALRRNGADVGLMELDFRTPNDVELAFFGVVPELVGSGAGRFLMNRALALAFARRPRRVHVYTCTHDHPAALGFYIKAGFRAIGRSIEIADDPRLSGLLSREAAPHVPIID